MNADHLAPIKSEMALQDKPDHSQLNTLFELFGVAGSFINYAGETIDISNKNRCRILQFLDIDTKSAASVTRAIKTETEFSCLNWVPPALVIDAHQSQTLPIHVDQHDLHLKIQWQIKTEQNAILSGEFVPSEMPLRDSGNVCIDLDTHHISCRTFSIPPIEPGYHTLTLSSLKQQISTSLIAAPAHSYEPAWAIEQHRLAGLSVQLYSLRSDNNWGIGDFSDLCNLVNQAQPHGIDFIVLNPLHFLDPDNPENCSPYSPIDRRFLNPLAIDPQLEEDFTDNLSLIEQVKKTSFQNKLMELRELDWVDYTAVTRLKYSVFSKMFRHFKKHHLKTGSARAKAFRAFMQNKGNAGKDFAEYLARKNLFSFHFSRNPLFHFYLQWIAEIQLEACQQLALTHGMKVGLIRDLAVASSGNGTEVQLNPDLFCVRASIGAPPDPLAPQGQNWGLPPMKPNQLKHTGFAHFINLLQSNMVYCGVLRIDHIMALMRLWWCTHSGNHNNDAERHQGSGAYVFYPMDELFAILRLESVRKRCVVIGEDLGIVPPQVRERMHQSKIFSNTLFYFEKYDAVHFKRPEHFNPNSLAMVANHDVPTLTAWWNKTDIQLRQKIGLIADEKSLADTIHARESDLIQILHWLNASGLLPGHWQDFNIHRSFDSELAGAILRGNSYSTALLVSAQLEDLCLTDLPVNIPGTCNEYPNWRRKVPMTINTLFESPTTHHLLAQLVEARATA